jgi:hypothetical protein
MLYICIISNKSDLNQTIRVSHMKLVEQSANDPKVKGLNPRERLAIIDQELYLMF